MNHNGRVRAQTISVCLRDERQHNFRAGVFVALLVLLGAVASMLGCSTAPPPRQSVLEQTVVAMDQRDWERADELIGTIVPPVPVSESAVAIADD